MVGVMPLSQPSQACLPSQCRPLHHHLPDQPLPSLGQELWYNQEPNPTPLQPGPVVLRATEPNRRAFYATMCDTDACAAERLQAYGAHTEALVRDNDHASFYFSVILNADKEATALLVEAITTSEELYTRTQAA